jgi:hypothetical protein
MKEETGKDERELEKTRTKTHKEMKETIVTRRNVPEHHYPRRKETRG